MPRALLVDTTSIFAFQHYLRDNDFPVQGNPNYSGLLDALRKEFSNEDFNPKIAFVAIDFENEGQKKFCTFLSHPQQGFVVDPCDYRDAFVVPDRKTPYQRLSSRLTYVAGCLSQKHPDLLVVTDAFDTYYPILDYVQNRSGRATIAFFRSGMEPRWQRVGLFNEDSVVSFVDLDVYSKTILGVDLGGEQSKAIGRTGLGGLKF